MRYLFSALRSMACWAALCALVALLGGCGYSAFDFERVSENGFDAKDNAVDHNDYAWSMEYFTPDNASSGQLYVGTGNNMWNLIVFQFKQAIEGGDVTVNPPVTPPEIRRYRPDQGKRVWERVLDYRDVEQEPFNTIGFRNMKSYRAQSDGRNYLYAASMGDQPSLWRTATGEPGSWEKVWTDADVGSVRWMEPHNGILYFAMAVDVPGQTKVGRIWATDGATFWPVITDGFGNPDNTDVDCLISFNGWLYAGTTNVATGYEIWKFAGPGPDGNTPVKIVAGGGPDARNELVGTPCIFGDYLYMGSLIFVGGINPLTLNGFKGFDIIRIDKTDHWETVVGPDSLSGYDSGFNHFTNAYCWWMQEHQGWLCVGTLDQGTLMREVWNHFPDIAAYLIDILGEKSESPVVDLALHAGADLYKTADGIHWEPVSIMGLGNTNNYGIRTMESVGNALFVGTANPFDGLEILCAETPEK